MKIEKPFLLIIEISSGFNTHIVFDKLIEATNSKKEAFKKGQQPICIYDLREKKYTWINEEFPPYGQTISNQIIQSYLNS